ncbi:MAG: hypothetical protein J6J23_03000 [Clostridia bacterium]|nr:hypothetical protein [Clostridia bacterium]
MKDIGATDKKFLDMVDSVMGLTPNKSAEERERCRDSLKRDLVVASMIADAERSSGRDINMVASADVKEWEAPVKVLPADIQKNAKKDVPAFSLNDILDMMGNDEPTNA